LGDFGIMAKAPPLPTEWFDRLAAIKRIPTTDELAKKFPPPHKSQRGGTQVWHYPLGVASGTLYSIHVSPSADGKFQAYMHMEPTAG
jgi:hypothetical protein